MVTYKGVEYSDEDWDCMVEAWIKYREEYPGGMTLEEFAKIEEIVHVTLAPEAPTPTLWEQYQQWVENSYRRFAIEGAMPSFAEWAE